MNEGGIHLFLLFLFLRTSTKNQTGHGQQDLTSNKAYNSYLLKAMIIKTISFIALLVGANAACPGLCSGNGKCTQSETCECYPGWVSMENRTASCNQPFQLLSSETKTKIRSSPPLRNLFLTTLSPSPSPPLFSSTTGHGRTARG